MGAFRVPLTFGSAVPFILIVTGSLCLALNAIGHHSVAKVIFTIVWLSSVNLLPVMIHGTRAGMYFMHPIFCIVSGLTVHLLFSFYTERMLYMFFLACSFCLTFFSIDFLLAYDASPDPATPWVRAIGSYRLIILISWLFVNMTLFYLLRITWKYYMNLQLKHAEVEALNHALEKRVEDRTRELSDRNEKLSEYAFMIAHILRAPLSRIRGLLNLSQISDDHEDAHKIKRFLEDSAKELDAAVHSISEKLSDKKKG